MLRRAPPPSSTAAAPPRTAPRPPGGGKRPAPGPPPGGAGGGGSRGGAATGCSAPASSDAGSPWRVRRFTYDSLSRLLTATNPESGAISYFYDAIGNLLQKVSPTPNQTGSAQHTVSYCYDTLNRITGKAY